MIIVFGGAFNPVTNAHLDVCDFVLSKYPSAKFVFLPVSSAYTKSELASNHDRVEMLKLATKGRDNVTISPLEISDSDYQGTYQSLIRISDMYQEEVAFVVGADNLLNMHKWINISGLLSEFKIIVLGRYDLDIDHLISSNSVLAKFHQQFIQYPEFDRDISSTSFRETFDQTAVPSCVYDYIIEHELYRGEDDV
jgi:nicotinate-nucleotide adenylyltransferase